LISTAIAQKLLDDRTAPFGQGLIGSEFDGIAGWVKGQTAFAYLPFPGDFGPNKTNGAKPREIHCNIACVEREKRYEHVV